MSERSPYPQDPTPYDPYGTVGARASPAMPGSVMLLAVLAIIFGSLGSTCLGFSGVVNLLKLAGYKLFPGPMGQTKISPELQAFGIFMVVLELILCVTLLTIGLGALSLKRWAWRTATSWWPRVMILWAFVRLIAQLVWIVPASLAAIKQVQQATPNLTAQQAQKLVSNSMVGGTIFVFLIQLSLPILFLLLWRSPDVVAAFAGGGSRARRN